MIKNETIENSNTGYPTFKDDLQRLISLVDKDEFMNQITDSIKSEFNRRFIESDLTKPVVKAFVCIIYWNRFSNEIKISFAYGRTFCRSTTESDFLSWIPVLRFTDTLFSESRLIKLYSPKIVLSMETVFNDSDKFKMFLSKKIQTKLNKNYKDYFNAKSKNDYSVFFSAYSRGENFPIDLFPIEKQYKIFWISTELFSTKGTFYPYRLPKEILPEGASASGNYYNIVFEKDKINEFFSDNYGKFSELIIEVIFYKLNSEEEVSSIVLKMLLDFLRSQEEKSLYLKNYLKMTGKSILEIIVEKQISIMKANLYGGARFFEIKPYKLIDQNSPETDKEFLEKSIVKMISEKTKSSEVSNYYEKLDDNIYKMLLKKEIPMIEGFTSYRRFKDRFSKLGNHKTLYSPVIFVENGYYTMLVDKSSYLLNEMNEEYNEVENLLISNEIKTTESVKKLCESLLMFLDSQLLPREKEHLRFVLSMDVVS